MALVGVCSGTFGGISGTAAARDYLLAATYASTSEAESSGDSWAEGAIITITGGPVFKYVSALDNSANGGHSGLIHKNPFNDSDEVGTVTAHTNGLTDGGEDPDTWGWTNASSGVKSTDYDLISSSGRSRLQDLTEAGRALVRNDYASVDSGDARTVGIYDGLELVSGSSTGEWLANIVVPVYVATGTPTAYAFLLAHDSFPTNWRFMEDWFATFTDTGKAYGTASRVYIYADGANQQSAIWFDDDSTPAVNGGLPTNGSTPTAHKGQVTAGHNAASGVADLALTYLATGKWTLAS